MFYFVYFLCLCNEVIGYLVIVLQWFVVHLYCVALNWLISLVKDVTSYCVDLSIWNYRIGCCLYTFIVLVYIYFCYFQVQFFVGDSMWIIFWYFVLFLSIIEIARVYCRVYALCEFLLCKRLNAISVCITRLLPSLYKAGHVRHAYASTTLKNLTVFPLFKWSVKWEDLLRYYIQDNSCVRL
jgi:hypothetical protein